jgi:hypothetical protein
MFATVKAALQRSPGRPRKWDSEAARKRAYRQRKAEQLADPLAARAAAQPADTRARAAEQAASRARHHLDRVRERLAEAEQRLDNARHRAAVAETAARQARAERDRARRLLDAKWRGAGTGRHLMRDPERLVAVIADLRADYETLRRELRFARQALGYPSDRPLPGGKTVGGRW